MIYPKMSNNLICILFTSVFFLAKTPASGSDRSFCFSCPEATGKDSAKLPFKVSAHRGSSGLAPENTLATFKKVLEMQVDYIEIDVRTSKDHRLMILHDGTLDRTTNGNGPMKNLTYDELRQLSAGKGFDGAFVAEKIPTLEESCKLLSEWNARHSKKTQLYVDCKDVLAEPLIRELSRYNLLEDAVFYGSDDFLFSLKTAYPKAKLMPSLKKPEDIPVKLERLNPYAFDVKWQIIDTNLVKTIHGHKIKVFTDLLGFTDIPVNYKKAADLGVDLIQTDFVERVYEVLK